VDIITSNVGDAASFAEHGVIRIGRSVSIYANGSHARLTLGDGLRLAMRRALRAGAYDVVHVHAPFSPTLSLLAIDEADCAVVGTVHTNFGDSVIYRVFRKQLQRIADRFHALIAVSPTAAAAHARYIDADWIVLPNGIDLDVFHRDVRRPTALPDAPCILFVGRFDPRNALGTLLDAFRVVRRARRDTHLVVVGDGPLASYYRRRARGEPRVMFTGALREERAGYYAGATMYACPTTRASFGITLLESMACGTPIVCSDIDGFRDVVQDGREAMFTAVNEPAALAESLVRLIDDESLCHRLGSAGEKTAARYAWPSVAERVLGVYAGVLGQGVAA
jgi:phosphatidylinositol alpha-mannosyltransferase